MSSSEYRTSLTWALAALLLGASLPTAAQTTFKIASLAPDGSSWITALRDIDTDLRDATQGQVRLKIYPGGVQGDEDVVLRKIRIGQLHGAGLGGTGLSHVLPDVLALEMPFQFSNYDEIDYVLQRMEPYYQAAFDEAGFVLLGWSDIGFVYLLAQAPVRSVDDIRGRKVWRLQDEPITGVLFEKAQVTSVPLAIPDVLLGLQTNLVDVVYASPAAAIVLQWFTRVATYTDLPINYAIGALLLHKKAFADLTAEQQQLLRDVAARHMSAHNTRSRTDNLKALRVMEQQGVRPVTPSPEAVATFQALVAESVPELVGKAFSRAAYDAVQQHLADLRASAPPP